MPSEPAESPRPCQMTTGRRRRGEDVELELRSELAFEIEWSLSSTLDGIRESG
jgi:hypothetical protein